MTMHRTVVFVDILGFACLVEKYENAVGLLDSFEYFSRSLDDVLADMRERGHTPLEQQFAAFHITLDHDVKRALRASVLNSIVFSDSAFVIFDQPDVALPFAQCLMRHMLLVQVPVRIGIGFGSYKGVRFSADHGAPINLHSAQFLGSAIVRAYRAESCGHSGMRILLHPEYPIRAEYRAAVCPILEAPPLPKTVKWNIATELNYLDPPSDDIPPPALPGSGMINVANTNDSILAAVREMRQAAPENKHYQYDYTIRAIQQMRLAYGLK